MDIFKWLNDPAVVSFYLIKDFKKSDTGFYLSLKINFIDHSELYVREYADLEHRKYSFHWQTALGNLLIRWDNAPHFPHLSTFPHHKHLSFDVVEESHDISFDEVMDVIKRQIQHSSESKTNTK